MTHLPRALTRASLSQGARALGAQDPDLAATARLPDDVGRLTLLAVPGLGPWSVDIYYLMALRRPDVWPEGDLALATALCEVKRIGGLPTKEEQQGLTSRWAPWRSVAARILWAHYLAGRGQYSPQPYNKRVQQTRLPRR